MHNTKFETDIVTKRLEACAEIRGQSRLSYAEEENRLSAFYAAAEAAGVTPLQAATVLVHKHIDALFRHIREMSGGKFIALALLEERFQDIINYMLLMEGLVKDEQLEK